MEDYQLKMLSGIIIIVLMIGVFVFEQYANYVSKKLLAKHGRKGWAHQRMVWIYKNKDKFPEEQIPEVNRFIRAQISGVICIGILILAGFISFVLLEK